MFMQHTGLEGEHQSYWVGKFHIPQHVCTKSDLHHCSILLQVVKACIERVADLIKISPSIKDVETDPPCPGMSRLRCFFFFRYGNPAKSCYARSRSWWMKNLRGLCYDVDKEYSLEASRLAIPQLMNEMNILRVPQQAEERLRLVAFGSEISWTPMEKVEENEEPSA